MSPEFKNVDTGKTMTIDSETLKRISNANPTAEVVTYVLAMRQRIRAFSDLRRLKISLIRSKERIVESDYQQYWKDLEQAGFGSIVRGRNGNSDRFAWHYSLKEVAKAAIEGKPTEARKINSNVLKTKRKRGRHRKNIEMVSISVDDLNTLRNLLDKLQK